jgi:ribosomal protein L7Ae-like RNA K-turn-binding protein
VTPRPGEALVRLLGLGMRARTVVVGVSAVRAGLQREAGGIACVVMAADASPRTREKVERLAVARGVPVRRGPVAERLGAALGRPSVQAVGVSDRALARGVLAVDGGVSGDNADS